MALPPDVLRQLYANAIAEHRDAAYQAVLEREEAERAVLRRRGGRTR